MQPHLRYKVGFHFFNPTNPYKPWFNPQSLDLSRFYISFIQQALNILPFYNIIDSLFNNSDFSVLDIMIITLIVAWIIFIILWKLVKTTIKTAVTFAGIVVLLYFGFGITPQDIWEKISEITQNLSQTPVGN